MKRFLYIVSILAAFAIGHGIGREQAKDAAYKQGYAEGTRQALRVCK